MLISRGVRLLFRTTWGAVLLTFLVGLVTNAGFALFYVGTSTIKHGVEVDADPGTSSVWSMVDQDAYTVRAKEMISGEPYRDTYRQPLFPAFHAVVLLIFGEHPTLLYNRLADSVLAALGCVVIYLLGRRLFGHTVGLVSALVAAVHINMVQKYGYIWSEVLSVPLCMLAVYFFVGFADRRRWRDLIAGGISLGLATLARPTTYYLIFLLPIWLWVVYGRITRAMAARAVAVVAVALAILAPWAVHNTVLSGQFLPVSGPMWSTLCACYAPEQLGEPLGANKGCCVSLWLPKYGYFTPEEAEKLNAMSHEEQSRVYRDLLPSILRRSWKRIPEIMVYRVLVFLAIYHSPGRSGLFYWSYHVQQLALFALFIGGLWVTRRQWRRLSAAYLMYLFLGVLVIVLLGGLPRYRLSVEPLIIIFASAYVVRLANKYLVRPRQAPQPA
jgi:4-amino-4-deoxy-L-arabinose transferase-like glycosyltransferase